MFILGTHFEELLKKLQPPKERLEAARDLPPLVCTYIAESKDFPTVEPHTRLVGSYPQGMAGDDVKDVDNLVRVSGEPKANKPEAKQLIQDMRRMLGGLPEALGYEGWAGIDIERARRSVHVYFKGHDFHLDFVPCIAPDGFENVLYVPDRGFNKWIASHPIGYINLLNKLQKQHDDKVKPLGRMLKHFRNYQMKTRKPKSYWLGALLVYHIQEGNLNTTYTLGELFHNLLHAIYCQYDHLLWSSDEATPNIPDPMLEHNISWNWSRSHFETFMRRVNEGRGWADQALEANSREKAIACWQKIFGEDYFPSDVEDTASQLAAAGLPGKSYITATGLVLPSQPASGIYTPSVATKFHGAE